MAICRTASIPRTLLRRFAGACLISAAAACESGTADVLWAPRAVPDVPDAQIEADAGRAGAAAPLKVTLDVEPPIYACAGECSTLIARVEGGKPPYVFMWSDQTLAGPGPHRICPTSPSAYSVVVSAGATSSDAGVLSLPQTTAAVTDVLCLGSVLDAGALKTASKPVTSCSNPGQLTLGFVCQKNTLGAASQLSYALATPLTASATYQISFDISDLVRNLATGLVADVYGASTPCAPLQPLGTLSVDATTTHQSFCATPEQTYPYIVITSRPDANALGLALTAAVVICPGCAAE